MSIFVCKQFWLLIPLDHHIVSTGFDLTASVRPFKIQILIPIIVVLVVLVVVAVVVVLVLVDVLVLVLVLAIVFILVVIVVVGVEVPPTDEIPAKRPGAFWARNSTVSTLAAGDEWKEARLQQLVLIARIGGQDVIPQDIASVAYHGRSVSPAVI
ncbi:MAG: hypothetical protein ACPIOQ_85125, partial [Promethearchaeia archaeon]